MKIPNPKELADILEQSNVSGVQKLARIIRVEYATPEERKEMLRTGIIVVFQQDYPNTREVTMAFLSLIAMIEAVESDEDLQDVLRLVLDLVRDYQNA